ncbi:MAG: hypothetical protein ACRCX2_05835 [Paraclostridium sp.]
MEDDKPVLNIPKYYEDPRIRDKMNKWKNGERSKSLRNSIMKTYWRHKSGKTFLLPSTTQYIDKYVRPLMEQAQYRNWKVRFKKQLIKEFINEKNTDN